MKILFYGFGNPGRQDDGLGVLFSEKIQQFVNSENIANIDFESNYQLNIEDADTISSYDIVVFSDASVSPIDSFSFTQIKPEDSQIEFTMHAVSPAFVLDLCGKMFSKFPKGYLMQIKGYEWELGEEPGENGLKNLFSALDFIFPQIKKISENSIFEFTVS